MCGCTGTSSGLLGPLEFEVWPRQATLKVGECQDFHLELKDLAGIKYGSDYSWWGGPNRSPSPSDKWWLHDETAKWEREIQVIVVAAD